jgi:hypothetical protein
MWRLRSATREGVEVEPVADEPETLHLLEAGMPLDNTSRQEVVELRLAQEQPFGGVVGQQNLSADPSPAKESQGIRRQGGFREGDATSFHYASSSSAWRLRVIVS